MTLPPTLTATLLSDLPPVTPALTGRQPIHTFYGGAQLYAPGITQKLGARALEALRLYGPPEGVSAWVHTRVEAKLASEPVEDLRIDFEDGFGPRSDAEEDRYAIAAAQALREPLPPFIGFRVRSLNRETGARCLRTLDLFLTNAPSLPLRITLPKIESPKQVEHFVRALTQLEQSLGIPRIALEIMVETPAATQCLPQLREAGDGRIVGAHLGAYDYLALCGIPVQEQHLLHPLCDHLRGAMQAAYGGTGMALADGVTTLFPVPVDKANPAAAANRESVQAGWRLHMQHIRHSLSYGFYQSWDLHPAQLVSRYAAVYDHFERSQAGNAQRLRAFIAAAAQAKLAGNHFDDVASAQGLLDYFLRARACEALSLAEVEQLTGLNQAQLETRSFAAILRE
jgi:citrate lyase beta subunit